MALTLLSGFSFDYDNLFGEGKVTQADLDSYSDALKKAHEAMKVMRSDGVIKAHLSKDGTPEKVYFSKLPYITEENGKLNLNSPASIKRLHDFTERIRNNVDAVVSLGIGGSFLGNKVLFDVFCGEFWNTWTKEQRKGLPKVYFSGQNIDTRRTGDIINHLKAQAEIVKTHEQRKFKVMLIVISKSGGTLDTMSNFMVMYDALKKVDDIEIEIVAVTDPNMEKKTLLKQLAVENGWETFAVPDGVGGRFTIFCEVGLTTAAVIGMDIEKFLEGARHMDEACQNDNMWENPAMLNAALKFAAAQKHGRNIEVMMPYGDYLKSVSEWYIQLLAESLGKKFDKEGNVVNYGRTPLVAVGTTDMHSQTQQHQEGTLDKVVQFIKIAKWDNDFVIPNVFPNAQKLADISGVTMSEALEVARQSNADALKSDNRYNACFTLPELNEYHLGELLYMLAMSVAYEGELSNVDAFNQPGVEAYKRIMGPKLQELKRSKGL
ncbi:MAG: glucose-6-phosphate isomerase [Selenomonadaceae bacterium]|nr:glucose-6-phosphate isomerase [Selenomonadaceae bacterium]MBR1730754.1 glucose-6-phosphate isomerase [Selenomonadaceae bacterium]